MKRAVLAAIVSLVLAPSIVLALDLELSPYRPVMSLSGKLRSIGSDTMLHEMELWAEGLKGFVPSRRV